MQNLKHSIVTRFPPSPTGNLHIGGLRTALFNYLYTRHHNGKFILRIEDTDKERSKKEFEQNILDSLSWLGLSHDEFYRQSERTEIYTRYLEELVKKDLAYISEEDVVDKSEETMEDKMKDATEKTRRSSVIRFRNPNTTIKFSDIIRGEISFSTNDLGDFIIAKSLSEPLYHFAVVVDDHEMGITHVIRGEEHISNTPRQILIGEAIGAKRPVYGHLPLILAADRTKLSKRKGAQAVTEYKKNGFLSSALINYAALLGWNPGTNEEIFMLAELVEKFDISKVQKAGAVYNEEKLRWINKEHLKRLAPEELHRNLTEVFKNSEYIKNKKWLKKISPELIKKLAPMILDRAETFADIEIFIQNSELDYVFEPQDYDAKDLIWKDSGEDAVKKTAAHISHVKIILQAMSEEDVGNPDQIKMNIWDYATTHGRGDVLWPVRFALTGRTKSADPFSVISILGLEESLGRLDLALKKLAQIDTK